MQCYKTCALNILLSYMICDSYETRQGDVEFRTIAKNEKKYSSLAL